MMYNKEKGSKMKIVFPLIVAMFLISCSDNSKSSSAKEEILQQVNETTQEVQKSAKAVVEQVKQKSAQVVSEVAHATAKVAQKVEAQAEEVVQPVEVATAPAIDASKLFAKCVGCHGTHGERKALGKSQVIQGWEVSKVLTALHGYKDGTYGSSMKGVMKSQISKFTEDELKALAHHISQL